MPTVIMEPNKRRDWIEDFDPESVDWQRNGWRVSAKNLIFSVFSEHIGFSVWLLWSIIVVSLNKVGFNFSPGELFWLVAMPNLVGAFLRLPYTFAVIRFGGRNWTTTSSLLLLIPCALLIFAVGHPQTPYWAMLAIAATAGVGGGNFASSMANINFFYPDRHKGVALGVNAAAGNIGVSVVQLVTPILIVLGGGLHLARAGYLWGGLAIAAAICAFCFMDNLRVPASTFSEQSSVVRYKHTWIMALLYVGTFGSFIGYVSAMPLLIHNQFPDVPVANYAFLGGLLGSLARPFGGWLSDRLGGSRVTFWNFGLMVIGVALVIASLQAHNFSLFLTSFLTLFLLTGIGNGSTFRMIPAIFQQQALTTSMNIPDAERKAILNRGRLEGAAVIGLTSAVGAFGGFLVPLSYGCFGIVPAFCGFLAYYVTCLTLTWWYYRRRRFMIDAAPNLAVFNV